MTVGPLREKAWEHCGLHCETWIMPAGHRCGYVFVEEGHPLHGVDGSDLPRDFRPGVNGGITYSGREGDSWVFGFDFAHCWDIPDDACLEHRRACHPSLHPDDIEVFRTRIGPDARVATPDMAVEDCEKLAELLDSVKDKPFVYTIDECEWRYYSEREPDEIICRGAHYAKVVE